MYKNKKVLVAGGTGTIGVPVVKKLIELQAKVTVISMDSPKFAGMLLATKFLSSKGILLILITA